jgi:hypothetical protein
MDASDLVSKWLNLALLGALVVAAWLGWAYYRRKTRQRACWDVMEKLRRGQLDATRAKALINEIRGRGRMR